MALFNIEYRILNIEYRNNNQIIKLLMTCFTSSFFILCSLLIITLVPLIFPMNHKILR